VALARAFIAKAIWNLATTRDLIDRIDADPVLRRLCGWPRRSAIPSEATFSRAFAEFASSDLPARMHEALVTTALETPIVMCDGDHGRPLNRVPLPAGYGRVIQLRRYSCAAYEPPRILMEDPVPTNTVFAGGVSGRWSTGSPPKALQEALRGSSLTTVITPRSEQANVSQSPARCHRCRAHRHVSACLEVADPDRRGSGGVTGVTGVPSLRGWSSAPCQLFPCRPRGVDEAGQGSQAFQPVLQQGRMPQARPAGLGSILRPAALCCTSLPSGCHLSQGSEYQVVVIPVLTQHYAMLKRNLLYTGVTRGKRLVVLVGQKKALAIAVRNASAGRRWSKLDEWLAGANDGPQVGIAHDARSPGERPLTGAMPYG